MKKTKLTERKIDELVVLDADDDSAWSEPKKVNPGKPISIRLSQNVIVSLKELAKLKGERGYQTLIKKMDT